MKTKGLIGLAGLMVFGFIYAININPGPDRITSRTLKPEKGCVFMTVMGEQPSEGFSQYKTPENVSLGIRDGLSWLSDAQLPNGGYGAGSHQAQYIRDPHAVKADPATTAMVGMAFLRSGTTLQSGKYADNLKKVINHLLEITELASSSKSPFLTTERNTQIQTKLGQNIDAVVTAQFFSSLLDRNLKGLDKMRIQRCLDICVAYIEQATDASGKQKGAGWAGVLQSGMANSALEAAQAAGVAVDTAVLKRSRDYQKGNYDEETDEIKADDGAGIVLYSVSGSVRASAKEARKAKQAVEEAKTSGLLDQKAEVNAQNLQKIGYRKDKAAEYATAYKVYESAKKTAQREDVLSGFGNNGGEEFLSYLQTGESMVVNQDNDWKSWYDDMSGRILKIQNTDGSWNGHHCITSPVFCTATSVLLLSVENDIAYLKKLGD